MIPTTQAALTSEEGLQTALCRASYSSRSLPPEKHEARDAS